MTRTTKVRNRQRILCGNGSHSSATCRTIRTAPSLVRLEYQAGHAIVWRDAICNWFLRTSGIPDEKGRVGKSSRSHRGGSDAAHGLYGDGCDSLGKCFRW